MNRKRVAIFYSEGGGGHRSVTKSLEEILKKDYDVTLLIPISTILRSLDPIKILTRDRFSGESLYNFFLKRRFFRLINLYGYFGEWLSVLKHRKIVAKTKKFLLENRCDLLISDFPYFNNGFLKAAEEVGIPFLIVVCDLYTKHYLHGIKNPQYPLFQHSVFFKYPLLMGSYQGIGLTPEQVLPIGFPVRPDFSEIKNRDEILEDWKIPKNTPVILVLMGYFGSQSSIEYFKSLRKQLTVPAHIIVILGKQKKNRRLFENVVRTTQSDITYTCIDFVDRVSDLFYISDIVITKSGGLSVSEAFYMKKPIILDWTKRPLPWEKMAGDFIKEAKVGYSAKSYSVAANVVNDWLLHPEKLETIRDNYKIIPDINFRKVITQYVKGILSESRVYKGQVGEEF